MLVTNLNGTKIDFDASVAFMDDDTREFIHRELAPCSEQEFFNAYEIEHKKRFQEEWELSKENPSF